MSYTPRTIDQIQAQMIQQLSSYPLLAPLLPNTSKVAKFTNWTYIISFCIYSLEVIWSILQSDIENTVSLGRPETAKWIQNQVLNFQYSATTPQVVVINPDFSVGYASINPSMRIITNCSVTGNGTGGILIKVTTAAGPLSGPQLSALNSFLDTILGPDINYQLVNALADTLEIDGTVFFDGQFSGSIVTDVTNALLAYLAALPFNGVVKVGELDSVIRKVNGVTDFLPANIIVSANGGTPSHLILNSQVLAREYLTNAGYMVNDPVNPFSSTLIFTIDNN